MGILLCSTYLFLLIGLVIKNAADGEFDCLTEVFCGGDIFEDYDLGLYWFDLSDCCDDFIRLPGGFVEG